MDKNWYYFFLEEDGRSAVVTARGVVDATPVPTPLEFSPDGWSDIAVSFDRDIKKRFGLVRAFSFPLRFTGDGATILRHKLYAEGVESKLYLMIAHNKTDFSVPGEYRDYYTQFFRGEVDLATVKDNDVFVSVEIKEGGLAKAFNANVDTTYEFPLDADGTIAIRHDGMALSELHHFLSNKSDPQLPAKETHIIGCGLTSSEGKAYGFAGFSVMHTNLTSTFNPQTSYDHLFTALVPIAGVRMQGKLKIKGEWTNPGTIVNHPEFVGVELVSTLGKKFVLSPGVQVQPGVEIPFDLTFDIAAEERFFLMGTVRGGSRGMLWDEGSFSISLASKYKETIVRAYPPAVLLDRLVEKVYGKKDHTVSALLSSTPFQWLPLTSGDGMRSLEGAVLKISLAQFLDIQRVQARAGVGIEKNKLVVEDIFSHFLNPAADPLDLGFVKSCQVSVATEVMCNKVKVGHKSISIDEVNGKFAINTTHSYTTPGTRVTTEQNLVSPAIADPYIIEHTRINFDGRTTTDGSQDNDIFVLHIRPGAAFRQFTATRSSTETITGPDSLAFEAVVGDAFETAPAQHQFTYRGTRPATVRVTLSATVEHPDDGAIIMQIKKNNDTMIAAALLPGTGTLIDLTGSFSVAKDDVLSVWFDAPATGGSFFVHGCSLLLEITSDALHELYRAPYTSVTGVPAGNSLFNVELLTPNRILRLWHKWFNSAFWRGLEGQPVHFETSERNADLVTVLGGVTYREKDDLLLAGDIGFKPLKFTVEGLVADDIVPLLYENPNRPIRFVFGEYRYKGFLIKGGCAPDDNREQVYELLCAPDTDEITLINR